MISTIDALSRLHRFEGQKRAETFTGSLLGIGLPERDRVLAAEFERFDAALDRAKEEAARTGQKVAVDGSRISLTEGGDTWWVLPDGTMEREYDAFEGFDRLVAELGHPPELDPARAIDPGVLLRAAYHAFWSPTATNWQPTRVVELEGAARKQLLELVGWPTETVLPALVLMRRDHYESLLGDVLEPYGLAVTAREESIDVGIFAETLAMSALGHGLTFQEHVFSPEQVAGATELMLAELRGRRDRLQGTEAEIAGERAKIDMLVDYLERGKYIPDSVMLVGHPKAAPNVTFESFEALIDAHSTQRVASPTREFSKAETELLWKRTVAALPPHERQTVEFVFFHWNEQTPPAIGGAMFEALYGLGADPEAKTGGEGGLLTAVSVRNYLENLARTEPDYVRANVGEGWESMSEAELQKATRGLGIRAKDIGRYLRERILRDGKYQVTDGVITDTTGKPLSIPVLVRLNKSLASTFGNFFLKFQNTHPQNGVLIANTKAGEAHWVYRTVGKAAAVLTYMSRAMGASSIIKTGPIDLAREPIRGILVANLDGKPEVAALHGGLEAGVLQPAMTFQVGYPLAGSDVIDQGTPGEHTGYEERRRDKRPPRERFVDHYLPAL